MGESSAGEEEIGLAGVTRKLLEKITRRKYSLEVDRESHWRWVLQQKLTPDEEIPSSQVPISAVCARTDGSIEIFSNIVCRASTDPPRRQPETQSTGDGPIELQVMEEIAEEVSHQYGVKFKLRRSESDVIVAGTMDPYEVIADDNMAGFLRYVMAATTAQRRWNNWLQSRKRQIDRAP